MEPQEPKGPHKGRDRNVLPGIREDIDSVSAVNYGSRPSLRAADTASSRLCTESLAMAF
jgi:hypothetical protein